jgi:hypothetical protein
VPSAHVRGGSNRAGNCAEGALVPALAAVGNVQKNFGSTQSIAVLEQLQASIAAQLTVPLYQGGSEYAAIRQAKETRDLVHYQQVRDALGRHVLILSPTRAQLKGSSRRSASACGVARTLTLHSSH